MADRLGRSFGWLWGAYAVSAYGTGFGFGAFPVLAVLVLDAGPGRVALLAAAGRAVGALLAVPLGPWVEFRRKRPVMVAADLVRCGALLSVPLAYGFGVLSFGQLLLVSVVTAAADIAFRAASGAYLKWLVPPDGLLLANSRFEATTWSATVLGPPLGGAAIGVLGPVTTVLADAVSYLLSALGLRAIGGGEPEPVREAKATRAAELLAGWRHLLSEPALRPLFLNALAVNGLIMATEPLLAVLLLGRLGYAPWEYGLAFAVPCLGGLLGARVARPLARRFGVRRMLRVTGVLRVCWPVGLAFVGPGAAGLALVMLVEFGLITCCGIFNPLLATRRLDLTPPHLVARTLAAWTVSTSTAIAALTAAWGLLATWTGPRTALGLAGLAMLATPVLLLPGRGRGRGRGRVRGDAVAAEG
ncbi:MFS transporter [Streptomyces sp. SID11385]|uniref:MFS transporter n=1 Tax=Streptomyces sp. SID11385 TaxID=2706031 RepID=UPI0013CD3B7A|nr:MFS transporter [Streptomyces sp. SID11385]